MSASRICPICVAGAPLPTCTPIASAVITRVNASTPGVKALSAWSKQIEFTPSDPHALAAVTRLSGARVAGVSVVPSTAIHAPIDWVITCSISLSCPFAVWFCVRIVTGLVPSAVLHCTATLPAELSWCARTGQAEPPESATPCRISGTISSNAYPNAPGAPPNAKVAATIAAQTARVVSTHCLFIAHLRASKLLVLPPWISALPASLREFFAAYSFPLFLSLRLSLHFALILSFQRLPKAHLKDCDRQVANTSAPELSTLRIEDGSCRGILRHTFRSRHSIASDTEGPLRPAQHSIRFARLTPQEQVNFFTGRKRRHAIDV